MNPIASPIASDATFPDPALVSALSSAIARKLAGRPSALLVVGICGAQGSGKSTLARFMVERLMAQGVAAAALSIDDLYRTRAERAALGREVHPLLATRGVPGTHDIALGLGVIAALERGEAAALPRFDKSTDDRAPHADWPSAPARCRVLLFEGWCVGARPQDAAALRVPVNALEADEDAGGAWRGHANDALASEYQRLFARIDLLALLAAPGFEVVFDWRRQQEAALRASAGDGAPGLLDDAALGRFIQHYERMTRHILVEMPQRADLVAWLAPDRSVRSITCPS